MTTTTQASTKQEPAQWAAVVSLSLGILAIVMSELLPASLLPRMADDLGVSEGAAGQSVTVTAIAGAFAALFISVVLPQADRRRVMIGLTLLAAISNLIVAAAPNLTVLLLARVLLGISLGGFWAMATAMAGHLVPANHMGRALTVINAGVSIAAVAAVPLGAWLGDVWGWRGVFVLGAGAAVLALLVQAATLPHISPTATATSGLRELGSTVRRPAVFIGLIAILLIFSGHFSGFTYIRPALESIADIDTGGLAILLLAFGVANVLGTTVSGPLADRSIRTAVLLFPALVGAGVLLMVLAGDLTFGMYAAAVLWGFGFGGVPTSVLTWGAKTEPTRLEQIGGLIVTACNLAIAAGAVIGGVLVDNVAAGAPLVVGGISAIVGAIVIASLRSGRAAVRSAH